MTTDPPPTPHRLSWPRWLTSRRRRVVAGVAALLVVGLIVLAVTDPFASPPPSGVTDNSYPTATATVTEQSLSSQNEESATLGYANSYTVAVPTGTAASDVTAARTMAQVAQAQVANAREALASAKAAARPTNASTMQSARANVSNDEAAITQATAQLAVDENLGCPASSSATVTSPVSASSSPSSSSTANVSSRLSPSAGGDATENRTGGDVAPANTGSNATGPSTPRLASAPSAVTGPVDATRSTSVLLMGSVNPNGADTTYYFEYGTSPNYGETTPSSDAGSGTNAVAVTSALASLSPGVTYHYRLVATSAFGNDFGQDATFQTSAAPSVTTGAASPVSTASESLSGTIDPNGADTTYYFEYGTTATFGQTSPVVDLGGGLSPTSVTATISGLSAGATYDYALVATSALGTVVGATSTFQAALSSCVAEHMVVAEDTLALSQAKDTLTLDALGQGTQVRTAEQTLVSDEATAASDENALEADEANVTNANTTVTRIAQVGARLHRGQSVYRLNNQPVPLFYGPVPLYRALFAGVSSGPDIAELNRNLTALGFERGGGGDDFTGTTETAVDAWQRSLGVPETGVVALGAVVIEPGPLEVATVSVSTGQVVSGGMAILTATSRTPVVTIDLDASQQAEVKVGDPVTITLPNNATTPGIISSVGTVAVTPSASSSDSGPTITVLVTPTKLTGIGNFDQAPVNVSITNATVSNVLTVPVDALLALASGGYAVEEIESDGVHQLVPVTLGLFDDAAGRVQVSGTGLAVGQKVVVPKL